MRKQQQVESSDGKLFDLLYITRDKITLGECNRPIVDAGAPTRVIVFVCDEFRADSIENYLE